MKKLRAFGIAASVPTALFAQDESFVCKSVVNGAEYTLRHNLDRDEGSVKIDGTVHQAQVLRGLNNATYLIANDDLVLTMILNKPGLDFSLSEHRPGMREDHGQCVAGDS